MDQEFPIRELAGGETAAVVRLCRVALDLPEDAAEAAEIVARLRVAEEPTRAGGPRRTVGLVVVDAGTPVGVALGSMSYRESTTGHVDLIAVAPPYRRRGIGRALLTRLEEALAGAGAERVLLAGNAPHYAWPGVDVRYTPAICAALALGYQQDRTAFNMTVELSDPAVRALRPTEPQERWLAARGITVHRARPADLPRLTEFARVTFDGAWDVEITGSVGRTGAGCHFAVRGDEVLGFAAYGSSRPSWFGPMGTAPSAQGSGIGGVLLRRCLRDQRADGHDRVQIGWVGPAPFYARSVDARIERVFFLYRRDLRL